MSTLLITGQPGLWPCSIQAKKTWEEKAFWRLFKMLEVSGGALWVGSCLREYVSF